MTDKGWTNTGQMPQRMKQEINKAKKCAACGGPHTTKDHDKARRAKQKEIESAYASDAPKTVRELGATLAAQRPKRQKLTHRTFPSNRQLKRETKPVLTHRARRMAKKLFVKVRTNR